MITAPWRSPLARALHLNRSLVYARYFQLATIDSHGYPANRTVVFRGFLGETNQIKIITDLRSQKASQIRDHPQGEICWYFPKSREQFRFRGSLTLVTADHIFGQAAYPDEKSALQAARKRLWQDISVPARSQFLWDNPGELLRREINDRQIEQQDINKKTNEGSIDLPDFTTPIEVPDALNPTDNFCLLLLDPFHVDHLELRTNPQSRHIYTKNKISDEISNEISDEISDESLDKNPAENSHKTDRIKEEDNWHTASVNP
ncbi:MAG: pyridoxamine 5'-phosphate oxidase [Coleofasciculaceae cyanobacterium SM2_1_6]|nr:pyridoxamine 5'-phosphate oxidase [Coleofasciculaceae cyanobacterium SM2_1_6]